MNRTLVWSKAFVRSAKRLTKSRPEAVQALQQALELLAEDAFHPELKTHKLKGKLKGLHSCYAGYDLRIVFQFVKQDDIEVIVLHTVGSHDSAY